MAFFPLNMSLKLNLTFGPSLALMAWEKKVPRHFLLELPRHAKHPTCLARRPKSGRCAFLELKLAYFYEHMRRYSMRMSQRGSIGTSLCFSYMRLFRVYMP